MAVVKNRLKIFEPDEDQDSMASTKPKTALKPPIFGQSMSPALQNFMNKQNDALGKEDKKSAPEGADDLPLKKPPDTPAKGTRNGMGSGASVEQNENITPVTSFSKNVAAKPLMNSTKSPDNRRGSQVNVPSVFQQDTDKSTNPPDTRRSSQVTVPEIFKVGSKNPAVVSEISSSDENKKPKPIIKPGSTFPRPPPGPKPQTSPNAETSTPSNLAPSVLLKKPGNNVQQFSTKESMKVRLPIVDQQQLKNAHSPVATSATATSSSSQAQREEQVTDLRSMLRPTKVQTATQLAERKAALKPVVPPGTSSFKRIGEAEVRQGTPDSNESQDLTKSSSAEDHHAVPGLPSKFPRNQWKPPVLELKHQNNEPVIERKSDSKKFKKVKLEAYPPSSTALEKPHLPNNIDLTLIKQQYQKTLQTLGLSNGHTNVDDEIYDDGTSLSYDDIIRKSPNKRQSERISIIPDMSAEEEEAWYDDGMTPVSRLPPPVCPPPLAGVQLPETDESYVDAETERQMEEMGQLYEDEATFTISPEKLEEEKKKRQKEEVEAKKKEEKERKEREKEDEKKRKKEEKERAKKEKEEMQLRKKFNLTGTETSLGEGTIKQDVKGGVLGGLSLKRGQTVTIVRLDNNPQNKWLIRSDTGMGYIESSVIEVDPSIIRQAMVNKAMETSLSKDIDDDDQPVYDDVPGDGQPNDLYDGEIYEECP